MKRPKISLSKSVAGDKLPPGFALIATISILVLLALISVGLLSLSTVVVRTTNRDSAMLEAKSNAKLALLLAMGELQKQAGPDQRITAPGGILSATASHPNWTGVWDSWKAGDNDPSGGDDRSDHSTIPNSQNLGMSPSYEPNREDHFRRWLVSLPESDKTSVTSADTLTLSGSLSPSEADKAVQLVGEGTLETTSPPPNGTTSPNPIVNAALINVEGSQNQKGRYAWWIGDESTKARLLGEDSEPTSTATAELIHNQQSPYSPSHEILPGFGETGDPTALEKSPSRRSWELLKDKNSTLISSAKISPQFHATTPYSEGLLCDVREGGMKRDLSGLLSLPINTRDNSDSFMLYRLGRGDQVPIQDLSAYYQLYKNQVIYGSRVLPKGIQVTNPNFKNNNNVFKREYTNLYRLPVPIKVQFLLSLIATERTPQEKANNLENTDTHKLNIGITPAVTLWNPNNVSMSMNRGADLSSQLRFFNLPYAIKWTKTGTGGSYTSAKATSLGWMTNGTNDDDHRTGFTMYFSGTERIDFEPGQVRVFSLENSGLSDIRNANQFNEKLEATSSWIPDRYIRLSRSDLNHDPAHIEPPTNNEKLGALTFKLADTISFTIEPTETTNLAYGSALQFFLRQSSVVQGGAWQARQYQFLSRINGSTSNFNKELMRQGAPDGSEKLEFDGRLGSDILAADALPFLFVNLVAGAERHKDSATTQFGGRRYASRPFLHSSPITGTTFIDRSDNNAHYNHGWNWWVDKINSAFEVKVNVDDQGNGFFGGGFTPDSGVTHVVQQEIPVAPPIAIAALSHAHLGGFSLATANDLGTGSTVFQNTTASGQGGLFPQTSQAIGNSYAHPLLAADKAYGTWNRRYRENDPEKEVIFADHSYLANKALWDEYFFSSISDHTTQAFDNGAQDSASDLALAALKGERPLPNRRLKISDSNLTENELKSFFAQGAPNNKGIDEIASHLTVTGAFNINSTSVEAWKSVLSSMRGQSVGRLDSIGTDTAAVDLTMEKTTGTPVGPSTMPNGPPVKGSSSDSADPSQWTSWRELTDLEIDQLANAIVKQVRLRGPFLSLSEFINRRLTLTKTSNEPSLAVKGALQAALDDPNVSINEGFRDQTRQMSNDEIASMNPAFEEALEGPIAYGSAAYVDQADVLRGLAAQLTPRGDTFVIRTYGDSLDSSGNVLARAWCEAVVQRGAEYMDPIDDPHLKQSELAQTINKDFGRRFRIISFRFLNPSEV